MRVQGIGRKQWHGCCTGTMYKVSRGCEQDGVQGRVRRDGSWVGVGAKSDVDSLCDAGVPLKHLDCRHMLLRTQNLRFAHQCRRGVAVSGGVRENNPCILVCLGFIHTLEIITRILREVVNRERLCDTNAFFSARFRNFWGRQTPCRSTDTI